MTPAYKWKFPDGKLYSASMSLDEIIKYFPEISRSFLKDIPIGEEVTTNGGRMWFNNRIVFKRMS